MQQVEHVEHVEVDDDEPYIPEGLETNQEAIDLPIVTTASLTVGEGLRTTPANNQLNVGVAQAAGAAPN